MKSLTTVIVKILPVTLFRKIVPKAGYDMDSAENRPMVARKSQNRNSEAAFGTIFRISKCF